MVSSKHTLLRKISPEQPDQAVINEAAEVLRRGGLVALPTETVYGLGANALDRGAVQGIFAAKGRAANNPIIVHVADVAAARELALDWPRQATQLAEQFWPGPLTLVLAKRPSVPDAVTAGGGTVGLRIPAHPVAQALLVAARVPIAAPSANRSSQVSPTTAAHVLQDLGGKIDMILDAGATPGGLESTVLDLSVVPPRLLRPGLITIAQIEAVIGSVDAGRFLQPLAKQTSETTTKPLRSPGLLAKHYAPRATVVCVAAEEAESRIVELLRLGRRIGRLRLVASDAIENRPMQNTELETKPIVIDMPCNTAAYSAKLYAALHELDDAGVEAIVVDLPPSGDSWLAVHDRLRRAAHQE